MKEYYKVVWFDDTARAVSYRPPTKDLRIEYSLDREIIAPIGGILVFEDQQTAMEFSSLEESLGILACIGWEPVRLPRWRLSYIFPDAVNCDPFSLEYDRQTRWICEDLWNHDLYHRDLARYDEWPDGSVAVRRLVPIEYIKL